MFIWVQMGINLQCSLYFLMSQAFGNHQWRKSLFNQKACVGVAYIMYPDFLNARFVASSAYFMIQVKLCYRKQPFIWFIVI